MGLSFGHAGMAWLDPHHLDPRVAASPWALHVSNLSPQEQMGSGRSAAQLREKGHGQGSRRGRPPDLQGVVLTGDGGARKTPRTTPLRARVGPAGSLPAPGPQHRDPTLSIFTGPTRSPRVTPDTHALSPQGRAGPSTVLWGPKQELRTDLQGRRNPALHCVDLPTFSSGPRIRQRLRRF